MADPFAASTYTPIGPEPEFRTPDLTEFEPSFGEYFSAAAGEVIRYSPVSSVFRMAELHKANQEFAIDPFASEFGEFRPIGERLNRRDVTGEQAKAKAEDAGVKVDFGDASYTQDAVDLMIERARGRTVRETTIAQYDPSMGLHLGVSLVTSLADPVNVAAAFIPFTGQARYAALLEQAGSLGGRTATRVGIGALEGLGGMALIEPFAYGAATQEGQDYTIADSLRNIAFGAIFGAGLHASLGAIGDKLFKRYRDNEVPRTPADIIDRLPQEINEAAYRAAISDIIYDRPVQSSDIIDAFMKMDPEGAFAISNSQILRRGGPEIDDTLNRVGWWKEQLSPKTMRPMGDDFLSWIRSQGGLRDTKGIIETAAGKRVDLPSTVYMGAKGAQRTERGRDFDEMLELAIRNGFVRNREEFIDAFKASQRGTSLRKLYRTGEEQRIQQTFDAQKYAQGILDELGINPKATTTVKAQRIVEYERKLVEAERTRLNEVVDRLINRNDDYKNLAGESKQTPPEPYQSTFKAAAQAEQTAPPKTTAEPTQMQQRTYTTKEVFGAIEDAVAVNDKTGAGGGKGGGGFTTYQRLLSDYLPGMSRKQLQPFIDRLIEERNYRVEGTKIMRRKLSAAEKAERAASRAQRTIDNIRRDIAVEFPNIGKSGTYYLHQLKEHFDKVELGNKAFINYVNDLVDKGKARVFSDQIGQQKTSGKLGTSFFDDQDKLHSTFVQFIDEPLARAAPKPELRVTVDLPPAPERVIETPPAEIDALTVAEIDKATAQYNQLRAQTEKRLNAMIDQLPPETAAIMKAEVDAIDGDVSALERLYNTAVTCLLRPPK